MSKNEIENLNNSEFHKKFDNRLVKMAEIESMFKEGGYLWVGHGTGRSGDTDEIVDLIFENGLRTKDNSLYFTSFVLSTPTPELIKQYREMEMEVPTLDTLKTQLDNWVHFDSKKIIIVRIPMEYINWKGDRTDSDGEMYGAVMNDVIQENGQVNYYVDSRFILGCYDANIKNFRINSKFDNQLTNETIKKLLNGYLKALKKTRNRLLRSKDISLPSKNKKENNYDILESDEWIEWDNIKGV